MTRTLTLVAAVLTLVGGLYLTNSILSDGPSVTLRSADADPAELERLITVYEAHVDSGRPGPFFPATLGRLLLQRASLTNDLLDYERAATHLETAFEVSSEPATGLDLARAEIALHQFGAAVDTVTSADAPGETPGYALVSFDAHIGIGDLPAAERSLAGLMPAFADEPTVLVRRAELEFARGDAQGAAALATEAARIAGAADLSDRELSFYDLAAARYLLMIGESGKALELASDATDRTPRHPGAWLLRARAAAARSQNSAAIEAAERSVSLAATPASLSFLADLYTAAGDRAAAQLQLDTIEAIAELQQDVFRRDVALARAEHGRSLQAALEAASVELRERPDAYSHHVMATALHATGDLDAAGRHAELALSLPDPDVWFRAGIIAADAGDSTTATSRLRRALEMAPDFHPLRADFARALLEELES